MHHYTQVPKNTLMNNKKWFIGSAFLLALLFLGFYRLPVFEIKGESHSYYVDKGHFELKWIHSIEKEEWIERYERKNDQLILVDTHFKTFGAGTPYQGLRTSTEGGYIHVELNMAYNELNVTSSQSVQTTIVLEDRDVLLYEYFDDYELITIKAVELPLWKIRKGDFL